jgi:alpha-tubulin suppressor-like RCC1 family protein
MHGRSVLLALSWTLVLSSCSLGYELFGSASDGAGGEAAAFGDAEAGAPAASPHDGAGGVRAGGSPGLGGAASGGGSALGGQGNQPPLDVPVVALSAGLSHTCGLSSGGEAYCWGEGTNLALGGFVGGSSATPQPVLGVGQRGDLVSLSVGSRSTCALTAAGDVYCWGNNALGQLGQGDTIDRAEPVLIELPERAIQVDLRYDTACAIDELSALYCWGENAEGQAGQGDTPQAPVASTSPLEVPSAIGWQEVSTGNGHVCAIRLDGELHCWGRNTDAQLGQADPGQVRSPMRVGTDTDWAHLSVGQSQTCALKESGTLYCWGANDESQLGIDPPGVVSTPTQVGSDTDWIAVSQSALHGCGLRQAGTLHCWGRRQEGQLTLPYYAAPIALPVQIGTDSDWSDLTVGRFHTCARRASAYQCTGENADGRLGDGSTTRSYGWVPVLAF